MKGFEKTPPEAQEVLRKPIRELGLRLEGSPVEKYVYQLYREIDRKGLKHFRPPCYLTDEWGCPSGEPVIGIPFYLADPKLSAVEKTLNDLEDEREIMMYMRHEAGHAFNYAYQLYKTQEWRDLFGPFRRPYREDYRPVPFSRSFVRHIAGWYAQKHPDEDFAETFAVWLTPRSNWRKRYKDWPGALKKLRYMDRMARQVAGKEPLRSMGEADFTVEQMESTVEDFYRMQTTSEADVISDLAIDTDLTDIFINSSRRKRDLVPAGPWIASHRKEIVDKVTYWTGMRRPLVKQILERIENRVDELKLHVDREKRHTHLVEITAYATTLAMNYITRGKFVQ
jgi:putative zinc-binding metallo-peptidase